MKRDKTQRTGKPLLTFIAACLLTGSATLVEAKTYRWVDKQGNTVYSQAPPPAGNFQEIKLRKETPEDQRTVAIEKLKGMQQQTDKTRQLHNEEADKREKQAKSTAIKGEYCTAAQDNLKTLENPRIRLLKDEDGNYETLDDKRRETLIKEAREQILEFCNDKADK